MTAIFEKLKGPTMAQISYQLYSSRNFGPLAQTLEMLASLGYTNVEAYGSLLVDDTTRALLGQGLRAHGLSMPSAHMGLAELEADTAGIIATAKNLGIKAVYCPHIMPDQRPTDGAGWAAFGARLDKIGAAFRAAGLDFGWHNHDFEFKALPDGSFPIEHLMAGGPGLSLELDIAWVARAGVDPLPWIAKYADRITAAHAKDIAPAGEKVDEDGWADIGTGVMNWRELSKALSATKAKLLVLEHDNPSDDKRFASASFAAASAL
jgi:sugar phosphate isomerase/epimerase